MNGRGIREQHERVGSANCRRYFFGVYKVGNSREIGGDVHVVEYRGRGSHSRN
jgi:hypothetical protein